MITFINEKCPSGGYVFWPDKASAHYARLTTTVLDSHGINYMKKDDNLTEVPQCRPIEDYFGLLATKVYEKI